MSIIALKSLLTARSLFALVPSRIWDFAKDVGNALDPLTVHLKGRFEDLTIVRQSAFAESVSTRPSFQSHALSVSFDTMGLIAVLTARKK